MNLHDLVSRLIIDTKGNAAASFLEVSRDSSLAAFAPELVLCATILLVLLARVVKGGEKIDSFWIALAGAAVALYFAAPWRLTGAEPIGRMEIFTGMLVYDGFSVFIRSALLVFAVLFIVFCKLSGIPDRDDAPDILTLVLGSTLGMCLMASANHLLMVFMGIEMASVPSYALAGLLKGRRTASEAALKYSVYGAGTAGVMLYGISLLAGVLHSVHIPTMAQQLAERFGELSSGETMVLVSGSLMLAVGLMFKLSAVPFHFWCPDVFEGAAAEVNAFLSVASKAAALSLLVRVAIGFSVPAPESIAPGAASMSAKAAVMAADTDPAAAGRYFVNAEKEATEPLSPSDGVSRQGAAKSLAPVRDFLAKFITFIALITCTFGNLAAYGQTNIKRLFAYSTIAHAGYMMLPIAAAVAVAGIDPQAARQAISALGIYVVTYLFMNLGAFAVVAFLRNALLSEEIADYAGLVRRCPGTVVCMTLILFSLVGLPPFAGFVGKFAIFAELMNCYQSLIAAGQSGTFLMTALVVGGLNTALCLFYYLRVVKVMTIDEEPRDRRPFTFSDVSLQGAFLWLLTLPTVGFMLNWEGLRNMALAASHYLFA